MNRTTSSIRSSKALLGAVLIAAVSSALLVNCSDNDPRAGKAPVDARDRGEINLYPALRGTIGQYAVLADSSPMQVEGYATVAELPNTGSSDMPPAIREKLIDQLYRSGAGSYTKGTENIRPQEILASNQIAAVEVRGLIPPLARKGTTFDLTINALPNTQTTSLAQGLLWTADLKQIGLSASSGIDNDTRTIALGRGPVFVSSAVDAIMSGRSATLAAKRALRTGRVIGGGVVTEDRDIRLQLFSPSYMRTAGIERAINSRFQSRERYASAESDAIVAIRIPPEFNEDPTYFLDLIKHMYLAQDVPGFSENKARELIAALRDPKAPHRSISLALQGLGRSVLPDYIQPAYTAPDPNVRFWTARAGAAMFDVQGLVVLQEFARNLSSPLHDQALRGIVEASHGADTLRATLTLADLLKSSDPSQRIAAYQGLVNIHSRTVTSAWVGRKFILDIVYSDSPPLIWVAQTGTPRIALIGRTINLAPGTLYVSSDNLLTVSVNDPAPAAAAPAAPRDGSTILAASVASGRDVEKENVILYARSAMEDKTARMTSTANLALILAKLGYTPDPKSSLYDSKQVYIGATYQRLVEMLAQLCKDQLVEAQFVLQKAPEAIQTPADIATGFRPERSTATQPVAPPAAAPATQPNPQTGH